MKKELKSPTCAECAKKKGYIPVTDIFTVYSGMCENCDTWTTVSTAYDWKLPGEVRYDWD